MHDTYILEKINNKIKILSEFPNEIKNKEWEELSQEIKNKFNDENCYSVILKLNEFIENSIETLKQEIENKNIIFSMILKNYSIYEQCLKEIGLLKKDETLKSVVEKWKN